MGVLRGPADRQRHARHPSRRGPGLQGRVPPLPDDEGVLRAPPGRLGLPWAARRARGREGARLHRQGRHRAVRRGGVQCPLPRVGAAACGRVLRHDPPHGLLGRYGPGVLDHGRRLRAERVVVTEADLRCGPARPGPSGRAVLPALRDGPVRSRARAGLRDGRRPVGLCPVPAGRWQRPRRTPPRRSPPGLDHHSMDPGVQHGGGRQAIGHLCGRADRRRRDPRRGRGTGRRRARRRRHGAGDPAGQCPRADGLRQALRLRRHPGRPLRGAGRLRHDRRRHRPGPPGAGLRGRRPDHLPGLRPAGREPGPARRPLRRRRPGRGRDVLQEGRRDPRRRSRPARPHVPARPVRARVPALLAMPHPAHLLRAAVLVHPHDGHQGRPPGAERADELVPRDHQVGPLRGLAHEQRGLGAVAQPVLGHAPADLALPGRTPHRGRIARRARRARRTRRLRHRPPSPVRRRHHAALSGLRGHRHARPRGHRRLVRLRCDALRGPRIPAPQRRSLRRSSTRPTSSARPSTRRVAGSTR